MILLGWRDAGANRTAWAAVATVLSLGLALLTDALLAATRGATMPGEAALAVTQGAEYVTLVTAGVVIGVTVHLQSLIIDDRRDLYRLWSQAGASRSRTCLTIAVQGIACLLVATPLGGVLAFVTAAPVGSALGVHGSRIDWRDTQTWWALAAATGLTLVGVTLGTAGSAVSATGSAQPLGPGRFTISRRVLRTMGIVAACLAGTPLIAVAGAAVVTTIATGGVSPLFRDGAEASAGGSVLPTLALTMLVALVLVVAASLGARRVVAGLITAVGQRCPVSKPWLMLGWRAGAQDAAISTGASGPLVLGLGVVGILLGFVDAANAYARSTGLEGGLERDEALVLLVPAAGVALLGHAATLVVLARRRARTGHLLRAAGATGGELAAAAAVSGLVVAVGALTVAGVIVGLVEAIFAAITVSVGARLEVNLAGPALEMAAFAGIGLVSSIIGAVSGMALAERGNLDGLDADK